MMIKSVKTFTTEKKMQNNVECFFLCEESSINRKRLFEEALINAKHGKVLYILQDELDELPELSQDLSSVNRHYMKMISFLYTKSLDTLIESISTLPDWQNVPSTIILDDLSVYCDKNDTQNACGLVAFLVDTARACSATLKTNCRLYISVTKEALGIEFCNTLKELYSMNTMM